MPKDESDAEPCHGSEHDAESGSNTPSSRGTSSETTWIMGESPPPRAAARMRRYAATQSE